MRDERGALVVVVAGLADHVSHVGQAEQLDDERAQPQNDLLIAYYLLGAYEFDEPAGTDSFMAAR